MLPWFRPLEHKQQNMDVEKWLSKQDVDICWEMELRTRNQSRDALVFVGRCLNRVLPTERIVVWYGVFVLTHVLVAGPTDPHLGGDAMEWVSYLTQVVVNTCVLLGGVMMRNRLVQNGPHVYKNIENYDNIGVIDVPEGTVCPISLEELRQGDDIAVLYVQNARLRHVFGKDNLQLVWDAGGRPYNPNTHTNVQTLEEVATGKANLVGNRTRTQGVLENPTVWNMSGRRNPFGNIPGV